MTMQTTKRPINSQSISATTSSVRNGTAFKNADINIYCTSDVFIKLGGASVTATTTVGSGYDKLIPAGIPTDIRTGGASHIATILGSGTATVHIHEWTNDVI
jgi:hypothetical protein